MERVDLAVHVREETGKGPSRRFRQKGQIPAVFYGFEMETVSLAVDRVDFRKAVQGKGGENVLINLTLLEKKELGPQVAMVCDMQMDPIRQEVLHVDFKKIDLKEKVEVAIPIELVGKAEGVNSGGILQQIERELEIRCMPLEIPDRIEVDVSNLEIGESIHIRDISVAEGNEVLSSGEKAIVTVLSPIAEEVEEEVEEEAVEGEEPPTEEEATTEEPESGQ